MSLWWPERLQVVVAPDHLAFARQSGIKRAQQKRWQVAVPALEEGASTPQHAWQASLNMLDSVLKMAALRPGTRVSLVLASAFVRFRVIPWSAEFLTPGQRLLFAAHCFAETYGERAREWTCRVDPGRFGKPSLASAIDSALETRLDELAATYHVNLVALQPALVRAYNCARKQLLRTARTALKGKFVWFVLLETGRRTLMLVKDGQPASVKMHADGPDDLGTLLDREWYAAGLDEQPCPVYLFNAGQTSASVDGSGRWAVTLVGATPGNALPGSALPGWHALLEP